MLDRIPVSGAFMRGESCSKTRALSVEVALVDREEEAPPAEVGLAPPPPTDLGEATAGEEDEAEDEEGDAIPGEGRVERPLPPPCNAC